VFKIDYFKQTRPISNSFITRLRKEEMVLAEDEIILMGSKIVSEESCVKLLFYRDDAGFIHMLIGIRRADEGSSEESSSEG